MIEIRDHDPMWAELARRGIDEVITALPGGIMLAEHVGSAAVPVAYHLHVVTAAWWDTRNERLLRDHLLRHGADRDEYGRLKRELAAAGARPP